MRWSYGRAWRELNQGDVIRYWRVGEKPREGVVARKMKPFADREIELKGGFRIGEFSRIRWQKIIQKTPQTTLDEDRN